MVWTFLAGAKRWFNPEMAKAFSAAVIVLIVVIFVVIMWGKAETAGGAKRDASWLQRFNVGLAKVYKDRAERAAVSARAAEIERERMQEERDQAVARAAAIAAEMAKLKDDPIVFPRAVAREMRK